MSDMAVPQNVYRHLQAGFAESNARRCVEYERNRIFHPGDAFIDVLRWLWAGIDSPLTSGESLACTLLADHFAAVNAILAEQEPPPEPMTLDEMITGLQVAGLESYAGPAEYQRICAMIRVDVPAMTGYTAKGEPADLMVPRQEPPAGVGSGPLATGALILNDALGFGTPGTIDHAGVMPGGAPSPMLLAFTKEVVAKFPTSRAGQAGSSAAVLCWNGSAGGGPRTMRTGKRAPKPDRIALQGAYGCLCYVASR